MIYEEYKAENGIVDRKWEAEQKLHNTKWR